MTAKLLVAACWIARGHREDTLGSLADAAFRALEDVYHNAHEYAQPSNAMEVWGKSEGTASRLRRNLIDGGSITDDNPALASVRAQLRAAARARRDQAADLYNQVQQVRSAYGEHDAGCAPVVGFYEPGEDVLSPGTPAVGLRTSVFLTNSPVLSWTPGKAIDLRGARLEPTNSPSVTRTDTGHGVEFRISAVLSEPEVTLGVSPCWPFDHKPPPISSDMVVGRSLLPFGLFWSGAKVSVAGNHVLRFAGHTTRLPERIVAMQSGVVVAGQRNFLLAALDL